MAQFDFWKKVAKKVKGADKGPSKKKEESATQKAKSILKEVRSKTADRG